MSLAMVFSRALDGLEAPEVHVEVQLANGLPNFTLVGLADTEVKESRERVRAALQQSGFAFPHNKRITVNLAPADLPKESGRFDLAIALGILAAAGPLDAVRLAACEFAGELSLAGELRPVRGALALALALRRGGSARTLVLPAASARIAAQVGGVEVRGAATLAEVVAALLPGDAAVPLPAALPWPRQPAPPGPDLRDVKGQAAAKRALEIAAAGGHSLLLVGPPGTGKSMLAQRLPGLLPPLDDEEALASAALAGLTTASADAAHGRRPVRAPHHTASAVALVGGGSPPRPGEISLAHGGVLFLDETPEFPRAALEALREPLESGQIHIARAARRAEFPARFQLVAAMNPCPCGWLGHASGKCRCTPDQVARYRGKLSGPLLDRIDLMLDVPAVAEADLAAPGDGESSAIVRARVGAARQRQQRRQGKPNALLAPDEINMHCLPDRDGAALLKRAMRQLGLTARAYHRILKVARTIADLADLAEGLPLSAAHVAEAVHYRRGLAN